MSQFKKLCQCFLILFTLLATTQMLDAREFISLDDEYFQQDILMEIEIMDDRQSMETSIELEREMIRNSYSLQDEY